MQEPDGIFSRFFRKISLLQDQQVLLGQGDHPLGQRREGLGLGHGGGHLLVNDEAGDQVGGQRPAMGGGPAEDNGFFSVPHGQSPLFESGPTIEAIVGLVSLALAIYVLVKFIIDRT